ncbi:radical SAM protein [Butyrivibrio sp. INlla16]|uniref:radical SAM/SPASM domain-containing protein n=1 Tax=Butyrivibrio sp. INlla16 TaxID=1520807 RepID=UPI0008883398|nr:radical SAM protein [Butyrivibrio sp. INlla16]SDB32723.1 radical SAM additional 4Fe4S-binding SPASM domain-containing protein [Butyrivibrio sp. INlla16]
MSDADIKTEHLQLQAGVRKQLIEKPLLTQLFFELTLRCNEYCLHCGSRCGDVSADEMTADDWKRILDQVKVDFEGKLPQINITGGEPLLYPHFEEILSYAHSLGFTWGMTTNGTLITPEVAAMLKRCGMASVSISIDGLKTTHDRLRGKDGAYDLAMAGIQNLIDADFVKAIQVTTVVNHETMSELDDLYEIMCGLDIDSWRIMGIEPIGRALDHSELLLTSEDHKNLMEFIRNKRLMNMPVTYGCFHYLGLKYEGEVRDWYFTCMAGITVASITSKGDVMACLDIERTPKTIQGNIHDRSFTDIWNNEFKVFRYDRAENDENCKNCDCRKFCMGGSCHTWDFENNKQRLCLLKELTS